MNIELLCCDFQHVYGAACVSTSTHANQHLVVDNHLILCISSLALSLSLSLPPSDSDGSELTPEQAQVVNHNMRPGEVIKVMAFAGRYSNIVYNMYIIIYKKYI